MPALFVFLLKVNLALLLFCAGYYLVLRHLTFYTLNRVYLLAAILFASVYPLINLSDFVQRHEELARPVQRVVINWQPSAQALVKTIDKPDYWIWIEGVFWLGAGLLAIRLFVQLFSLYRLYKNSAPATIDNHLVRVMDKDAAPFSFWQSIFVNPANHEPADLKAILLHEQVHVNQWHTIDILLAELSSIFYWFNPGIWLMKKAIRENVEFITDQKILKKGIDSKTYQYSLVSVSFNNTQPGIVNHFNLSTIKKRIIMMNAKRSSKINLTRYVFMVPVVIVLLLVFSISKADFAKPFKIKLTNVVKPTANAMHVNIHQQPDTLKLASKPKKGDTTQKTTKLTVITDGNMEAYYVNGVLGHVKNINPDDILSMHILTYPSASQFIKEKFKSSALVVFVTTKGSAAGLKLKQQLDDYVKAHPGEEAKTVTNFDIKELKGKIDNVTLNDMKIIEDSVVNTNVSSNIKTTLYSTITDNNDNTDVKVKPATVIMLDGGGAKRLKVYKDVKINGVTVNGTATTVTADINYHEEPEIATTNAAGGKGLKKVIVVKGINASGVSTTSTTTTYGNGKPVNRILINSKPVVVTTKNGPVTTVQSFTIDDSENDGTSPVIYINGHEESENAFKNVRPGDIESITVLKGDADTKMYGNADKTKNGVLVVTTKSAPRSITIDGKKATEAELKNLKSSDIKEYNVLRDAGKKTFGDTTVIKVTTKKQK